MENNGAHESAVVAWCWRADHYEEWPRDHYRERSRERVPGMKVGFGFAGWDVR